MLIVLHANEHIIEGTQRLQYVRPLVQHDALCPYPHGGIGKFRT